MTMPKVERRLMTPDELMAVEQMRCVRYLPMSFDKRFMRRLTGCETISEKESAQLWRIFVRYRRQMNFPAKSRLLAYADKHAAPDLRKQAEIDEIRQRYEAAMNANSQ